jgi:NAD(P)H dehydrogenase (quinone)
MTTTQTLLVTGAGGYVGRFVLETLLDQGVGPLIATTRDPAKLADLAARGVDVRKADFDAPETLAAAFKGADRLLLISTDALGHPGQRQEQHRNAVAAAVAAGVKHVVYLSAPSPRPTVEYGILGDHYWTEQALAASGLGFTFLRDHLYAETLLMGLPHALEIGTLYSATGTGGRNYVWRDDCARTAAAALAAATTGKTLVDVTGPAPVTLAEVAALASEISGRPLVHVSIPVEALKGALTGAGLPAPLVNGLAEFDEDAAQGFHAITTSVVKDLTGREPATVREFLVANRAALLPAA